MHLGGADIHAVETIPGSLEALAVLDVLEEFPGTKAWISFQCQDGGRLTATGEKIEDAFCAIFKHRSFRFKVRSKTLIIWTPTGCVIIGRGPNSFSPPGSCSPRWFL